MKLKEQKKLGILYLVLCCACTGSPVTRTKRRTMTPR